LHDFSKLGRPFALITSKYFMHSVSQLWLFKNRMTKIAWADGVIYARQRGVQRGVDPPDNFIKPAEAFAFHDLKHRTAIEAFEQFAQSNLVGITQDNTLRGPVENRAAGIGSSIPEDDEVVIDFSVA
jgi:hypothetical protein